MGATGERLVEMRGQISMVWSPDRYRLVNLTSEIKRSISSMSGL